MSRDACLVGVDIGGTKTSAKITHSTSADAQTITTHTNVGSPESVLRGTIEVIESLLADSPEQRIDGLGIGVPGQVDPALGTVRLASNLGIGAHPFALGPALSDHFDAPTAIENDVRATAAGLYERANTPKPRILTYLSIGTGLSTGTVVRGHLLRGAGGVAGEIGQVIVDEQNNKVATIEARITDADLVSRAALSGLERSEYLSVHSPDVMSILAGAVNTIFMAYDPDVLIVGGGVGTAPAFFEALIESVQTLRRRSAIVSEFLDPARMAVLEPGDSIGAESALVLAEKAYSGVNEAIHA